MKEKRDILEVIRLANVLASKEFSKNEKIKEIKLVRDNGDITSDEALEITIEYFT